MSPKLVLSVIGCWGFALGLLSAIRPMRLIGLYQWIMERLNWKVAPIDLSREIRNTRILGVVLAALSLFIFCMILFRF